MAHFFYGEKTAIRWLKNKKRHIRGKNRNQALLSSEAGRTFRRITR